MHSIISAIQARGKAGLGAEMQCPGAPGEAGLPRHFEEYCQHSSAASRPSALFRNCPCGKQQQQSKAGPLPGQPTDGQQRGLSDYFLCNWKHLWRAFPEAHTGSAQASTLRPNCSSASPPAQLCSLPFSFFHKCCFQELSLTHLLNAHLRACFPEFPTSSSHLRCEKWGRWWLLRGGRGGQERAGCRSARVLVTVSSPVSVLVTRPFKWEKFI